MLLSIIPHFLTLTLPLLFFRTKVTEDESAYNRDMEKLNKYKENAENNITFYNDNIDRSGKLFETFEELKKNYNTSSADLIQESNNRNEAFSKYYNSLQELTSSKSELANITSKIDKLKEASEKYQ